MLFIGTAAGELRALSSCGDVVAYAVVASGGVVQTVSAVERCEQSENDSKDDNRQYLVACVDNAGIVRVYAFSVANKAFALVKQGDGSLQPSSEDTELVPALNCMLVHGGHLLCITNAQGVCVFGISEPSGLEDASLQFDLLLPASELPGRLPLITSERLQVCDRTTQWCRGLILTFQGVFFINMRVCNEQSSENRVN